MMVRTLLACLILLGPLRPGQSDAADADVPPRDDVLQTMKRAATYYRDRVARHGGYVYFYSLDFSRSWGEGETNADTIFVEPPGTPAVGLAYLRAWSATKDRFYLDAARETAAALVAGQLESGGWAQAIYFAPDKRAGRYRNGTGGRNNNSSLDDNQTQSALQFLMRVDQALGFQQPDIHDAATYGLAALLKAQFPSGGFPQVWSGPVARLDVLPARYPDYDWKTEGRVKNYHDHYTLNDGLAGTVSETLIVAHQVTGDEAYWDALKKLGDFLILAQLPDPQPAWCQQYNDSMIPIWARKFEPPAITGSESQDAMQTLLRIANYTGDKRYLEPLPKALDYFAERCLLPDGRLARFYELKTNRPLYMDREYQLTYDDSDVPTHYSWKVSSRLDRLRAAYAAALDPPAPLPKRFSTERLADVRRVLRDLDDEGRWVSTAKDRRLTGPPKFEPGLGYLSSAVFIQNLDLLSEFLELHEK